MKERPILFSGEMVRAILDGRKTQTRRIIRDASDHILFWRRGEEDVRRWVACDGLPIGYVYCPYGEPGDRLWVRETWWHHKSEYLEQAGFVGGTICLLDGTKPSAFHAVKEFDPREYSIWRKRPSIHMPRWASRILIDVTDVRVQRLHEISEEDCREEGFPLPYPVPTRLTVKHPNGAIEVNKGMTQFMDPKMAFYSTWQAINGKRAPWSSNPWVWAVTFKRAS